MIYILYQHNNNINRQHITLNERSDRLGVKTTKCKGPTNIKKYNSFRRNNKI